MIGKTMTSPAGKSVSAIDGVIEEEI